LQVGDTGPVESARRSNSRVLGSPFSGLSGQVPIYVFPEMKLRGLVISNFNIHVSVSDLCFPKIGLPIFLQPNRQTDPWNI
jgi:hypothetical protein